MQLLVLGMHRSGTSVLARLLNMMGAYFGGEGVSTGASAENPKGFWERRDVRNLNDGVLFSMGCDWDRVSCFDIARVPREFVDDFNHRASQIVLELDAHRPWLLKEPRLCLLLPLWLRVLEAPVCVHILRHPVEVAASLRTRNGIPLPTGLALWERYNRCALQSMRGLPSATVLHRQLMVDPAGAARDLFDQLAAAGATGLRMPGELEIGAFVSKGLYRERQDRADLKSFATVSQVLLFEQWADRAAIRGEVAAGMSARDLEALREYEETLPLFQPKLAKLQPHTAEDKLKAAVARLEQEIRSERERAEALAGTLSQEELGRAAVEREIVVLREWLDGERRAHVEAMDRAAARASAAESRLSEADAENGRLGRQVAEADKLVAQLRKRVADVEVKLKKAADRDRAREERIQDLERLLQSSERQRVADADEHRRSLEARFNELRILTEATLTGDERIADLRAAHESVLAASEKLKAELHSAQATFAGKELRLKRRLEELDAKIERSRGSLEKAKGRQAELEGELFRREVHIEQAGAEIRALQEEAKSVSTSLSWRITRPIRSVRNLLAGVRGASEEDAALLRRSAWFDADWYLRQYPDVAASAADPVTHYLRHGAAEGREPGPGFSGRDYIARYPDVGASGVNPLVHYIRHGASEGRLPMDGEHGGVQR